MTLVHQRTFLTEDEHIKLTEVGDEFWIGLGKLAARCIVQMPVELPVELQGLTTAYLQDKCSIYGTRYSDDIKELRK